MIFIKSNLKSINSKRDFTKKFFFILQRRFFVAGTSPKAWIFFPFVFPQFIDFNANYVAQFYYFINIIYWFWIFYLIGYALLASKLIEWLKANPKVINTISACVLIIIAIIIALTQNY